MKINRRDKKLDALLGKKVQIEFTDGTFSSGVLRWNERFSTNTPYRSQTYYLELVTGKYSSEIVEFRKGHVKSIKEIEEGK